MLYVHICITLLSLSVALYLYTKSSPNITSSLLKWIWYLVIFAGVSILACQFAQGIDEMFDEDCDEQCDEGECVDGGGRMMGGHHMMMFRGKGMHGQMEECCMGMSGNGCHGSGMMMKGGKCSMKGCEGMMKGCEGMEWNEEVSEDTTGGGKVITKKITIETTDGQSDASDK